MNKLASDSIDWIVNKVEKMLNPLINQSTFGNCPKSD